MSNLPINNAELDAMLTGFLREDLGDKMVQGDITSMAVIPENASLSAMLSARDPMVLAGVDMALQVFKLLDASAQITTQFSDGQSLVSGDVIMTIAGNARAMLAAERTALNLIQHLSGIATITRQYVTAISHTNCKLLDTRKTTPGLRLLEKYATHVGGAQNHRLGLYDAIMMKDNHIAVAGDIALAVANVKAQGHEFIEVECDTLEQVKAALETGVTRLLLDNMSLSDLREAVGIAGGKVELEASGGVMLESIGEIAATGVDYISVGRITQSAPAVDIGLDFIES